MITEENTELDAQDISREGDADRDRMKNQNLLREAQEIKDEQLLTVSQQREQCYRMWCDNSSPYSCKLRSYMHYKSIPYKRMRNNMQAYLETIPQKVGMSIIPVLLTPDDRVMQDTTPIMAVFEEKYLKRSCIPQNNQLAFVMWLVEEFADEYMGRFSMHYRWGNEQNRQTLSHRLARSLCYGNIGIHPTQAAPMVLDRQSGFDKPLGLVSTQVRESLDKQLGDLLKILDQHFEQYQFLLGDKPSLADFALYGHLKAHLYNDPFSAEIMETKGARTCNWIETIDEFGDTRGDVQQTAFGEWMDLSNGTPKSLTKLLAFIGETYIPFALGTALASQRKEKTFEAEIAGLKTPFQVFQYRAWSFEQLQKRYLALTEDDRAELSELLVGTKILPALMEHGTLHCNLFDGFNPPYVVGGIADARIKHIKEKERISAATNEVPA